MSATRMAARLVFGLMLVIPVLTAVAAPEDAPDPVGRWTGVLEVNGAKLRVVFNITADGDRHKITMDSPDQGAAGIRGNIDVKGAQVEITVSVAEGRFRGTLAPDGRTLSGNWHQAGYDLPLVLTRDVAAAPEISPAAVASQPHGAELPGTWLGTLEAGTMELRLQYNVTVEDGELRVTLDSLDQGANGILAVAELLPEREVVFRVPSAGGDFRGALSAAGDFISGRWAQAGREFPLVLMRMEAETVLHRPQEPQPPFPYEADEVSFPGGAPDVTLAGTLTLPEGDGPFPAVVLVSGSGPQNRDEELLGHKPFLVLADHLTRAGIAVLRYDDRGIAGSTGDFGTATSEDFAADAEAALDFLRGRPEIRADLMGIVGHSEGGLIAPMVAARRPDLGFIVLLAGPGVDGRAILRRQNELLMRAGGGADDEITSQLRSLDTAFATLAAVGDDDQLEARLVADLTAEATTSGDDPDSAAITAAARQFASPWMRFFLFHDPAPVLARVRCPVLALNGGLDLQVEADQNLPAIRAALEQGGNDRYEVRELEGLNHLFQKAEVGTVAEYGKIEETMSPELLVAVSDWILELAAGN